LPCYHKVITLAHAADGLDDLGFIVLNDFDAFEVLQAGFGEYRG
jgi:hypothetical protein